MLMTEQPRTQTITNNIGVFLSAILIFALLLSGIGVIFIGKITGQVAMRFVFLGIGVGIEIIALFLIAILLHIRFISRS